MNHLFFYLFNFWPPFFGSGIKVEFVSKDLRKVRVRLKKRPWTSNIVGTQYGGSIFSMTDPFYMTMLLKNLGKDYLVWDKSARVSFLKPGKTSLYAEFQLSQEEIDEIKRDLEQKGKLERNFLIPIHDTLGIKVAEVEKTVWMKKKTDRPSENDRL